jgi:hypothetical protein
MVWSCMQLLTFLPLVMLLLPLAGEHGAAFLRPQAKLAHQRSLVSDRHGPWHPLCFPLETSAVRLMNLVDWFNRYQCRAAG